LVNRNAALSLLSSWVAENFIMFVDAALLSALGKDTLPYTFPCKAGDLKAPTSQSRLGGMLTVNWIPSCPRIITLQRLQQSSKNAKPASVGIAAGVLKGSSMRSAELTPVNARGWESVSKDKTTKKSPASALKTSHLKFPTTPVGSKDRKPSILGSLLPVIRVWAGQRSHQVLQEETIKVMDGRWMKPACKP
jgi:hypothetical protein